MKILIVHATAGAGHKKAAEAIFKGFHSQGRHDVRLVDVLDYTNPFFKKVYPWFYVFLVTRMPWAWAIFFGLLDFWWLQPLVRLLRRLSNGLNGRRFQEFLVSEQFDAIFMTQFLSAEICASLKRRGKIGSKLICVVTDFDVHRIWVNAGIDVYTGACEYTIQKLISLGVDRGAVFATGIPTDTRFAARPDVPALKKKLGLQQEGFTVLITTGSFGMGPVEELIRLLEGHQLLIVCGNNKHLYEHLKPSASSKVHVLGLVDNMDELMSVSDAMVTKPGGLSIAEALVKKLPMIFFSAIPGQETNNIKVLRSYGLCQGQSSLPEIARTIRAWSSDPGSMEALRLRMGELSKPDAVADIVKLA